ncbi:MAG TPA: heavy-metal-associated domain-containing protein [Dehalococcoidia bacterium]|nr:heavy-metal-associated domain-containing protein [Dehalococcoidia bacterium]
MAEKVTLEAPDISCEHCIASIRKAVTTLPGVQFLSGDPESKLVTIEYNPSVVALERVEQAMAEEGYPVKK